MSEEEITQQMKRLLYLIAEYSKLDGKYGVLSIKELPVKTLIFKGIIENIFDYDYAPQSLMYIDNRRYLNISQEGVDDLEDLRELGFIQKIRLATKRHNYIYSYSLTPEGIQYLQSISIDDKNAVDQFINCTCGNLYDIVVLPEDVVLTCDKCNIKINTEITEIEDVKYKSVPAALKTRLTVERGVENQ